MSHIVNFLPWRETRRRQRLRMAGLLIVGLLLILLVAILASRLNKRASHSLETARISADDLLYSALQQRERAMRHAPAPAAAGTTAPALSAARENRSLAANVTGDSVAYAGARLVNAAGIPTEYPGTERTHVASKGAG